MLAGKIVTSVKIAIGSKTLQGNLVIPDRAKNSLVIFAHGSGSSRLSPRNVYVAEELQGAGFRTLLFDLLTEEEDENYETRFDIDLLTERLEGATDWVSQTTRTLRIGYFGASTGAAAALNAAANLGQDAVSAVVSRGGRPDMAASRLPLVNVPTLLVVGGRDQEVLELNRSALALIGSQTKKLVVVPHATHLFEESGALEQVAKYATNWFQEYL